MSNSHMMPKNGYITQLLQQYNFIIKHQGFHNQKQLKEYQLLVTEIPQRTTGFNPTIVRIQIRKLEQLSDDNTDLGENDNWAELTTTLTPTSYVHKLIDSEIEEYAKRGINIHKDMYVLLRPTSAEQ